MTKRDDDLKLYYSISEVAAILGVSQSQIRFWEREFDILKPAKNNKGERRFTKPNLEQLRIIITLLKEKGYTIEGARRELEANKKFILQKQKMLERLERLRGFLGEMKAGL